MSNSPIKSTKKSAKKQQNSGSIKAKILAIAIALGIVPVATVSLLTYSTLNSALPETINLEQPENSNVGQDKAKSLAAIKLLNWILLGGTAVSALLVSVAASYIAQRAVIPLVEAANALEKIRQGNLDTRLSKESKDELGMLNNQINSIAAQIKTAQEDQKNIAQRYSKEKDQLELAIQTLLDEVSEATNGDLTVRANLDSMELSTVADLFNAIIDSLQDIAIETKQSSTQVGVSLKQNEEVILVLAEHALSEAKETRDSLVSVEQMSNSIKAVAANASQAEKIANDTYNTVIDSSSNMDLTVESILALRTTVGETSKKMKRLGESSQKISQVVSFIEEIAMKTNVLAINATVEAGRAGEYGQGFTIVAEQVGALAEQSAAATKEIASIVATIQAETKEVNQAMESGTTQVVETTRIVESTKQSLGIVLEKSQEINQLMESISHTTVSQADTSQNLTELMQKISQMSETTSKASQRVAQSIVDVAEVATKLESTVAQFKVSE
ncbi:MAG: methyl-accepting chemotaxis protein [Cyanobacteria bacterium P01_G01_bin.19]